MASRPPNTPRYRTTFSNRQRTFLMGAAEGSSYRIPPQNIDIQVRYRARFAGPTSGVAVTVHLITEIVQNRPQRS
jgi:hypothetical protein